MPKLAIRRKKVMMKALVMPEKMNLKLRKLKMIIWNRLFQIKNRNRQKNPNQTRSQHRKHRHGRL